MARTKPRAVGTVAAALTLAATGLIWTSSDAVAWGACVWTIPADHHSVSVSCDSRPNASVFRVKTYFCNGLYYESCYTEPVYGEWVPWGGTSSVNAYPFYVDTNRVSVEYGYVE